MDDDKEYTVGEVAAMFGVSVRLLHHWDDLGVAPASWRSWAGYRLYTGEDLERLQQALIYRDTGMPLAEVRDVLDQGLDPQQHLRSQWRRLRKQQQQVTARIAAVERLLESYMTQTPMSPEEKAAILGADWDPAWEEEANQQWGDSPEWAQAILRQKAMTAAEFRLHTRELTDLEERMASAMAGGVAPDSPAAIALAAEHRQLLSAVSFDMSPAQHYIISRGYTKDERFRAHYDRRAAGLAEWLAAAIAAASRQEGVNLDNPAWG